MTREEYEKLVKSSAAFQEMDKDMQARILASKGKDMEAYAKIFATEQQEILSAKKELVLTTERVVQQFGHIANTQVSVERQKVEDAERKKEEEDRNKLLSQI